MTAFLRQPDYLGPNAYLVTCHPCAFEELAHSVGQATQIRDQHNHKHHN